MTVFVLGRFPPPVDGQTLATERLATLLEDDVHLVRSDMEPSTESIGGPLSRAAHFSRIGPELLRTLSHNAGGTVLWTSISPDPLGHIRDLTIVLPALRSQSYVFGVVHRGNFRKLFTSRVTTATARGLAKRLDGFIFLSRHLADDCSSWIPEEKRIVIPNTIDDGVAFSDAEVRTKQQEQAARSVVKILFVGHMLRPKGYLDVLGAVDNLHKSGFGVEGHFVGPWRSASDQAHFDHLVYSSRLGGAVFHHGAVADRPSMKELYRQADILVLPSYYRNEAQPLVILEALNAGIPIVSTPHAGIPEIIRNDREGLLVSPRNSHAIAGAVRRMMEGGSWARFSEAARRRFVSRYSPSKVRQSWLALLGNNNDSHE